MSLCSIRKYFKYQSKRRTFNKSSANTEIIYRVHSLIHSLQLISKYENKINLNKYQQGKVSWKFHCYCNLCQLFSAWANSQVVLVVERHSRYSYRYWQHASIKLVNALNNDNSPFVLSKSMYCSIHIFFSIYLFICLSVLCTMLAWLSVSRCLFQFLCSCHWLNINCCSVSLSGAFVLLSRQRRCRWWVLYFPATKQIYAERLSLNWIFSVFFYSVIFCVQSPDYDDCYQLKFCYYFY